MIGIAGVDQDPERGLLAHYRLNVGRPNQVLACFNCAHHHEGAHVAWDELWFVDRRSWRIVDFLLLRRRTVHF